MARIPSVQTEPKGLAYDPDFLSRQEHDTLVGICGSLDFGEVQMHGQVAKREVRHFGYMYGYESWSLEPTDPLPEELGWLQERAAGLAGLTAADLREVLVTRYPPGAGIGWHRDAPMFGSKVIGVSLLSPSRMRFQRKVSGVRHVYDLVLDPGSAYVLAGEVRWAWQHSIPAVKELRYSITFRTVRESFARGRRAIAREER
ncbi:MAG: alpha-ketoglutarate-dependent dioxygenase AlkB [Actinomycetota bacterium]|nr:alpha-ketoglutarate-dependent dioxygenase AlkB [Actinomycetota bacterium]